MFLFFKARNFGKVSTMLKIFTAYSNLVAKFLHFVVKFFYCLPSSIYDEELRQEHQFFYSSVQKREENKKAPIFPDWKSLIKCSF